MNLPSLRRREWSESNDVPSTIFTGHADLCTSQVSSGFLIFRECACGRTLRSLCHGCVTWMTIIAASMGGGSELRFRLTEKVANVGFGLP